MRQFCLIGLQAGKQPGKATERNILNCRLIDEERASEMRIRMKCESNPLKVISCESGLERLQRHVAFMRRETRLYIVRYSFKYFFTLSCSFVIWWFSWKLFVLSYATRWYSTINELARTIFLILICGGFRERCGRKHGQEDKLKDRVGVGRILLKCIYEIQMYEGLYLLHL